MPSLGANLPGIVDDWGPLKCRCLAAPPAACCILCCPEPIPLTQSDLTPQLTDASSLHLPLSNPEPRHQANWLKPLLSLLSAAASLSLYTSPSSVASSLSPFPPFLVIVAPLSLRLPLLPGSPCFYHPAPTMDEIAKEYDVIVLGTGTCSQRRLSV